MSGIRFMMDVAALPMIILNPIVLLLLAFAVGALIVSVFVSARKRNKERKEIEQRVRRSMEESAQSRQDQQP